MTNYFKDINFSNHNDIYYLYGCGCIYKKSKRQKLVNDNGVIIGKGCSIHNKKVVVEKARRCMGYANHKCNTVLILSGNRGRIPCMCDGCRVVSNKISKKRYKHRNLELFYRGKSSPLFNVSVHAMRTYREIAKILGISHTGVQKIELRALKKFKDNWIRMFGKNTCVNEEILEPWEYLLKKGFIAYIHNDRKIIY